MLFESLTEEQEDAVLEEVGYTRKQLEADILVIREWLEKQQHLPPSRLKENDNFIKHFLTGCKGSLENTKKKIDSYYSIRAHSEIFENRDPLHPETMKIRKWDYIALMPKTMGGKAPHRIYITKLQDFDPVHFNLQVHIISFINLLDLFIREEKLSIRSIMIFDGEGFSNTHVMHSKPSLLKECITATLEIFAFRLAKICVINAPTFADIVLNNFVFPFLTKKIRDRVVVVSKGYEELHKFIDRKYLPKDYEGECASLKDLHEHWWKIQVERHNWYINELSEKCNESKRIVQGDTQENPYFGVNGSLKKLVVD